MKPDNERIQKLPVWARDLIASLERQRDCAEKKLADFRDDKTPSSIYTEEYENGPGGLTSVKTYIQNDQIYFNIDGKTVVCVRVCPGYLRVRTQGLRSSISIQPEVSNVVRILGVD